MSQVCLNNIDGQPTCRMVLAARKYTGMCYPIRGYASQTSESRVLFLTQGVHVLRCTSHNLVVRVAVRFLRAG